MWGGRQKERGMLLSSQGWFRGDLLEPVDQWSQPSGSWRKMAEAGSGATGGGFQLRCLLHILEKFLIWTVLPSDDSRSMRLMKSEISILSVDSFFFFKTYLYTLEGEHVQAVGKGRGRGRQADSTLSKEPHARLHPRTLRQKSHVECSTDRAPQAPLSLGTLIMPCPLAPFVSANSSRYF